MTPRTLLKDIGAVLALPQWRGLWIATFILLAATNFATFSLLPFREGVPDISEALALMGSLTFQAVIANAFAVAAIRIAGASQVSPWAMDGGWWLYFILTLLCIGVHSLAEALIMPIGLPSWLHFGVAGALAYLPILAIARWRTALAVEGWRASVPGNLGANRIFYRAALPLVLIAIVPLGMLHTLLSQLATFTRGTPGGELQLALLDAGTGTILIFFELAMMVSIYRQTKVEQAPAAS